VQSTSYQEIHHQNYIRAVNLGHSAIDLAVSMILIMSTLDFIYWTSIIRESEKKERAGRGFLNLATCVYVNAMLRGRDDELVGAVEV